MIIDYARRFWYRTKTVGKDGTTQIEVKRIAVEALGDE